jgi:hypothetical protein
MKNHTQHQLNHHTILNWLTLLYNFPYYLAYKKLNSRSSLSRSSSQILVPIKIGENSNTEEGNSIYPSFLTPKNDYYNRSSVKRPVFIFSDEQTSDEIDLNSTVFNNVSNGK